MLHLTHRMLNRLLRRQDGAAFTEYGLLLLLVVIAVAVAGTTLSDDITTFLNNIGGFFSGATIPDAPAP
jgi:Flp pilus assembly pilin Flp